MRPLAVCAFVTLAGLVLSCGGTKSSSRDWSKATPEFKDGDLDIKLLWVAPQQVLGLDGADIDRDFGIKLVVKLMFQNRSATKVVRTADLQSQASLFDEHDNAYAALSMPRGFYFGVGDNNWPKLTGVTENSGCDRSDAVAHSLTLHPGKCYVTHLFFEKPADVATKARLLLPYQSIEGVDSAVLLQVDISR